MRLGITTGAVLAVKESPVWAEMVERLSNLYKIGVSKLETPGEFNQGYYVAAKKYQETLESLPDILIKELEKK